MRLVDYIVGRQRLLQLGNACVGDLGFFEVENHKMVQPRKMHQPGVGPLVPVAAYHLPGEGHRARSAHFEASSFKSACSF